MAQYLVYPSPAEGEARRPAVVVIHEWWGVNDQIRSLCDRWAKEGFVAVAPDLYGGKVVPFGKSDEASAAMNALDFSKAVQDIAATIASVKAHPRCNGTVAVTGYCMGGALSFAIARMVKGLAAVVPFYGMPPGAGWDAVDAPIQAHFASHDTWATVDGAKQIQAALAQHGTSMELHVYDAQHAFCNDQRPEVYDASACAQAWQRAVAFVREHSA